MAGGRPTDYTDEMPAKLLEHFNQPLYIKKKKQTASGGRMVEIEEERPNSMPTFERFAVNNNVTHNTLRNWCKEYPEFLSAYNHCKDIQKDFITEHGMMGNYNAGFAKFIAINVTDLQDRVVHEVRAAGITLNVTPDESGL